MKKRGDTTKKGYALQMINCDIIADGVKSCNIFIDRLGNGIQNITGIHPSELKVVPPENPKTRREHLERLTHDLFDNIYEAGEKFAFQPDIPDLRLKLLQYVLIQDFGFMLSATMKTLNTKTLKAMCGKINEMMKMQNKTLNKFTKNFGDVIRSSFVDESGFLGEFLYKAQSLSDNAFSAHQHITRKHGESVRLFLRHIEEAISDIRDVSDLLVNEGLVGVKDDDGRDVTIIAALKGEKFKVRDILTGEESTRDLENLSIKDRKTLEGCVFLTYSRMMTEMLMGRSRYIKTAVIPVRKDERGKETKEYIEFKKSNDIKKIDEHLKRMKEYGKKGLVYPFAYTITKGQYTYTYIMIKNGEGKSEKAKKGVQALPIGKTKEVYTAYLISKKKGKEGTPEHLKDTGYTTEMAEEVMPSGFYRANKSKHVRAITDSKYKDDPDVYNVPEWEDFQRMKHQPQEKVMLGKVRGTEEEVNPKNMWETVSNYRDMFRQVFEEIKEKMERQDARLNVLKQKLAGKGENIDDVLEQVEEITGFHNTIWKDREGNLHTPGSFMRSMGMNYFPMLFHDQDAKNDIKNAIDQIAGKIEAIKDELGEESSKTVIDNEYIESLKEQLTEKNNMLLDLKDTYAIANKEKEANKDNLLSRSVFSKNRTSIMDYTNARTDFNAIEEYVSNIYRALEINDLKIDLLTAIPRMPKQEHLEVDMKGKIYNIYIDENKKVVRSDYEPFLKKSLKAVYQHVRVKGGGIKSIGMQRDLVDHMINRTKAALSDPTVQGGILPNTALAELINVFRSKSNQMTPEAVQSMIVGINSFTASWLLASPGATAVINNTQRANVLVVVGKMYAEGLRESNTDKWKDIAQHTGVENVVNVLNEVLLGSAGGEVALKDFLFFPVGIMGIKIPWKGTLTWVRLHRIGRESFIKKGDTAFNKFLEQLLDKRNKGEKRYTEKEISIMYKEGEITDEQLGELMKNALPSKMSKVLSTLEQDAEGKRAETLRHMRQAYWDILFKKKTFEEEDLIREFKILVGDVKGEVLKRGVSATMMWWFDEYGGAPGKGIMTMKETEIKMRRETAIVHLNIADGLGLLGTGEDRFKSEKATFIARAGVYSHMFGMSQAFLPDYWAGAGRAFGQFKGYPYNQVLRDWRVMKNFWYSTEGEKVLARLATGMGRLAFQGVKMPYTMGSMAAKTFTHNRKPLKESMAEHISEDQMAYQMASMLYTRVFATVIGSLIYELPGITMLYRAMRGKMLLRGMENPLFGLLFRTLLWSLHFGVGRDEEDDVIRGWTLLLIPPLIGAIIETSIKTVKYVAPDEKY